MKKIIYLFILVTLMSGCATPQQLKVEPNRCVWNYGNLVCNKYEVEFISDPPGAKIEINNDYIGETPVKRCWDGAYGSSTYYIIRAYPTQAGQYTQTKMVSLNQGLPRKIYFNMNLGPVTPSVDVNVNN